MMQPKVQLKGLEKGTEHAQNKARNTSKLGPKTGLSWAQDWTQLGPVLGPDQAPNWAPSSPVLGPDQSAGPKDGPTHHLSSQRKGPGERSSSPYKFPVYRACRMSFTPTKTHTNRPDRGGILLQIGNSYRGGGWIREGNSV